MGSGVKGSTCAGLRVATPRFPGPPNLTALKCLAFSSNSTCPYTHTRGNRLGCLAYMDLSYWGNCWCPVNRLMSICTVPLTLFTLYLKDRLGTPTWRPVFCFSIASKQAPLHCTLFPQIQCHFFPRCLSLLVLRLPSRTLRSLGLRRLSLPRSNGGPTLECACCTFTPRFFVFALLPPVTMGKNSQ